MQRPHDIKDEIQDQIDNKKIKRQRRRSSENYEISFVDKKEREVQEKIENLALESQADTLVKRINKKKDKPQYYPYKLEDFGILQLQEFVSQANIAHYSSNMQLFTIEKGAKSKLTVYKIKQ